MQLFNFIRQLSPGRGQALEVAFMSQQSLMQGGQSSGLTSKKLRRAGLLGKEKWKSETGRGKDAAPPAAWKACRYG